MPHGGELTISTFLKHEMVNVTLADTGSGIPRDLLPNVFNPFFSTKDKGAGLGLPQSRKMLDEMGGEIELDSAPDQGTIVTLRPASGAGGGSLRRSTPASLPLGVPWCVSGTPGAVLCRTVRYPLCSPPAVSPKDKNRR